MNDSVLISLIEEISPHSVLVFDKIDEQLTNAGILQALDEPEMKLKKLSSLMRPGWIDIFSYNYTIMKITSSLS